jgi:hypothetical protein
MKETVRLLPAQTFQNDLAIPTLLNPVRAFRAQRQNVCGRVYRGCGVDSYPVGNERREEPPGANAQGDILEQARSNLQEAIQLMLEANECFNP